MPFSNKLSLAPAAVLLCILGAGCACMVPADPSAGQTMTQAEMEQLGAQAEQEIAAGQLADAAATYVRVVTAFPNSAPAWFRLGTVYLRTDQAAYSQQAFERALRADPDLTKAHANLALAHLIQFRAAAQRAVASDQVPEANRLALRSLLRDVDHALAPATSAAPAVVK